MFENPGSKEHLPLREAQEKKALNYKLKLPSGNSGFIDQEMSRQREKSHHLCKAVDCAHQNDLGLMLHHGSKEEYVSWSGQSTWILLPFAQLQSQEDKEATWLGKAVTRPRLSSMEVRNTQLTEDEGYKHLEKDRKRTWLKPLSNTLSAAVMAWFISLTLLF